MKENTRRNTLITVLTVGSLWGIFEATAGYLLHLLPFNIGWLVWYPVASFFMYSVYQRTGKSTDILLIGMLSAGIKLMNLMLPVRIDRVLNPAVSILFEALSLCAIICVMNKFKKNSIPLKAAAVLMTNTLWRLLYILYILLLVPDWMREIPVISSREAFLEFFVIQNLITSLIILIGLLLYKHLLKPIRLIERRIAELFTRIPARKKRAAEITAAVLLMIVYISLQLLL